MELFFYMVKGSLLFLLRKADKTNITQDTTILELL